jgi:hypothetical protein
VHSVGAINDCLHTILDDLFENKKNLFPKHITDKEVLHKTYQAFRTCCPTLDTRAHEMNVADKDIDIVNRWKLVEKAKGTRPSYPMRQYYAELSLLIKPFFRYTKAM